MNALASVYEAMDRNQEAVDMFHASMKITKLNFGDNHPNYIATLSNLARLHRNAGEYDKAEPLYLKLLDKILFQIEQNFPSMSEKEKRQYWATIKSNFETFNSFAIKSSESKNYDQLLSRMYNNQLAVKAILLSATAKIKKSIMSSGDTTLVNLYGKWASERDQLSRANSLSPEKLAQQGIDPVEMQASLNDLEKQLSQKSAVFATTTTKKQLNWKVVQRTLQPSEAAIEMIRIEWLFTDSVFYGALIVTPKTRKKPELVLLKNGHQLEKRYLKYYKNSIKLTSQDEYSYQQYWQPIMAASSMEGIDKVYFSPDGVYNQINLSTFFNTESSTYLLDELDIHVVTNTKELTNWNQSTSAVNPTALLIGRPTYEMGAANYAQSLTARADSVTTTNATRGSEWMENVAFADLPNTEVEITGIEKVLSTHGTVSQVLLKEQATEENVKALNSPGILHIATHGFFVESQTSKGTNASSREMELRGFKSRDKKEEATDPMLRSGIALAGVSNFYQAEDRPNTNDGILTAYEATTLSLDNTDLVVLSACETGKGEIQNGEGVYGLQRGLKVAGAKTILMSLWKVDDAATQALMNTFYENWIGKGVDKRTAFRQAQDQIKEKYKDPYYWGAFVMVGE